MSQPAVFIGKWTFGQSSAVVQIDSAGALTIGSAPSDPGAARLNAYGTTSSFVLQANNGKYVSRSGSGYVADKAGGDPISHFSVTTGSAPNLVVSDLGIAAGATKPTGIPAVWNNSAGKLMALPTPAKVPATAEFTQDIVTPGTDDIMQNGFSTPQPDLSWVNLSSTDFTMANNLDLTQANLANADLTQTTFSPATAFSGSSGSGAIFDDAVLNDCDLSTASWTGASFVKTQMDGVDMNHSVCSKADFTDAVMTGTSNFAGTVFTGATMVRSDFENSSNIIDTSFVGAVLTGANFQGASVTGTMDLSGADCTGIQLFNPATATTIFPQTLRFDAKTNFRQAKLQYLDLRMQPPDPGGSGAAKPTDLTGMNFARADLTGCNLDQVTMNRTNFGFATLADAKLTGGVQLHAANLSNASLQGTDLTGAQLGGIAQEFRVGDDRPNYAAFLQALNDGSGADVATVFKAEGRALTGPVTVSQSTFAQGKAWEVSNNNLTYMVFLETLGASTTLAVYLPTTPAVLSNAFMVNVNLNAANLYNVRASGAQLYATAGKSVNLNRAKIDGLQANNANMGNIDLSQANLAGVNLDYAVLTAADFTGATMTVDATGGQVSFNGANLQGAKFTSAIMHDVILANAAVAVANPNDALRSAGVKLFELDAQQAVLVTEELDAASPDPQQKPTAPRHTFTVPIGLAPKLANAGPAPAALVAAMAAAKIVLAKDAFLVPMTTELFWTIDDGSTSFVVFKTVDTNYTPALGVATGTAYTPYADFYLPLSLERDLRNGPVNAAVVQAFKTAGTVISATSTVRIGQHPVVWQVISASDVYTLWIRFESDSSGVSTTIFGRVSIPNLVSVFGSVSMPLSDRATIIRISSGGWTVSNDANNPFNSAMGYIEFNVLPQKDGSLAFYGSLIRIVRSSGPDQLEFYNIPCATTELTQLTLSGAGNTICPNGALVAANEDDQLPYADWLAARLLPRPPNCVPDPSGSFFCPN